MSCARPVVLAVDGQAREILEAADAGLVVEPENADALAQAIARLADDPNLRTSLGQKGRSYIRQNLSRQQTAMKYIQILKQLVQPSPTAKTPD